MKSRARTRSCSRYSGAAMASGGRWPVMSRLTPILNSRSVYITRVTSAPASSWMRWTTASRSEVGGTAIVNQRLYWWFRS